MEELGTGAGIAALGFWLFIAVIVAASIWDNIRKRDAKHETLRRIIESGQNINLEITDRVLGLTESGKDLDRDLKVSGWIMVFLTPGLAALGWGLSMLEPKLMPIMLGVSALVGFLSIGFFVAAYVVGRWYSDNAGLAANTET